MKKITFFIALLGLIGCATTSNKESKSASTSEPMITDAPSEKSSGPEPTLDAETEQEKPKAAPAPSQYAALNEAVKAQVDEKIYSAATQILAQSPTDMKALNALAMYQYKKGRFELAQFLLNKAIAANPKGSALYANLGVVLLALKENRDAVKTFRKALEINDREAVAAANLGAIYVHEKDYPKALIVLETAYKEGIRDLRVLNNYGIALTANGKYDRAVEMYKAALKEQSSNKEVLFNYATLLVEHMGKFQEGLDVINRLKFVGGPADSRNSIIALENKAKTGLK